MTTTTETTYLTAQLDRLATPSEDGFEENARVKRTLELKLQLFQAELAARPVVQAVDPRLAPLAARIDRLAHRQRMGYSAARANEIAAMTAQYDAIKATE